MKNYWDAKASYLDSEKIAGRQTGPLIPALETALGEEYVSAVMEDHFQRHEIEKLSQQHILHTKVG